MMNEQWSMQRPDRVFDMRFNALIVAAALLAVGAGVALAPVREAFGLGLDDSWQLALIHAEFALAPLLFLPARGPRAMVFNNLTVAAACWAAAAAVVALFSFASMNDFAWQTRGLSTAVWLACGGLLSLAARGEGRWIGRARILLLCAFGLPPLWHYLALEYGGASVTQLRPLSPSWAIGTPDVTLWPLVLAGGLCWVAAFAIPDRSIE
jgi:hypothetical protein